MTILSLLLFAIQYWHILFNFSAVKSVDVRPITVEETAWKVPVDTRGMDVVELAKRVRFEANNIIRYLTKDNRDTLFLLLPDKTVRKISEVQAENLSSTEGHHLTSKYEQEPLAEMK